MLSLKNALAAAGLVAIITPGSAMAAPETGVGVTYRYQGNPLELFREGRPNGDEWIVTEGARITAPIEAYFVFNRHLPANARIDFTSSAVQPLKLLEAGTIDWYEGKAYKDLYYWGYEGGEDPFNPLFGSNNSLSDATFATDEAGNIKAWLFSMDAGGAGSQSGERSSAGLADLPTSDVSYYSSSEGGSSSNWNVGKPGTWTVTPAVPEPESLALTLSGLLAVAMAGYVGRSRSEPDKRR